MLGDTVSFFLGAASGGGSWSSMGRGWGSARALRQVEDYFARHGGKTILIGRFIGLVRALAPFIAGSTGMRYRAFAPYSILGTGLWSIALILIGYFFSQSLDSATKYAGRGPSCSSGSSSSSASSSSIAASGSSREPARGRGRDGATMRRPAGSSTWAAASARRRSSSGPPDAGRRFGLEFTTLMAVLAVGPSC